MVCGGSYAVTLEQSAAIEAVVDAVTGRKPRHLVLKAVATRRRRRFVDDDAWRPGAGKTRTLVAAYRREP